MKPPANVTDSSRPRILVVDDEPHLVALCKRILRQQYDVTTFTDGKLALDAAIAGDFDLIISNMNMPHVSGHELFTRVCAARPAMTDRFVLLTGGAGATGERSFDQRLAHALQKPFRPEELLTCVRTHLAQRVASGPTIA
jgi:DNA-binding response OmpR family regulator